LLQDLLDARVWPWAALALGLIVGSFANVCIHRLPLGQSVGTPPSACPSCGARIKPYDNVPVLAWLWLGGRCRSCRARISVRYPLVEAANGALYYVIARQAGPTVEAAFQMAFVTALLVLSLIDLDHQILPDVITLPGIAVGIARSLWLGAPPPVESIAAALLAFLAFWAVAAAARRYYGQDALGMGDWKLAAMLGAFLGGYRVLLAVLVGSLLGAVVGLSLIALGRATRTTAIPFGTFLAVAGIVVLLFGGPVLAWYRGLMQV
jgi:leader peptidase (prepilin peptidase)/N-methyltransferase